MNQNYPAPPLRTARYGRHWVGVPQHVLRLTTMRANSSKDFEPRPTDWDFKK